jgi:hypothetical protein
MSGLWKDRSLLKDPGGRTNCSLLTHGSTLARLRGGLSGAAAARLEWTVGWSRFDWSQVPRNSPGLRIATARLFDCRLFHSGVSYPEQCMPPNRHWPSEAFRLTSLVGPIPCDNLPRICPSIPLMAVVCGESRTGCVRPKPKGAKRTFLFRAAEEAGPRMVAKVVFAIQKGEAIQRHSFLCSIESRDTPNDILYAHISQILQSTASWLLMIAHLIRRAIVQRWIS